MVKRDPVLVRNLVQLLEAECKLHERYQKVLEQERRAIVAADLTAVSQNSTEREKLNIAIQTAQDRRLAFLARYPQGSELKLSLWIESHLHPADRAQVRPVLKRLTDLVRSGQAGSRDLSQLLSFSLGLVESCLSIIWSATQGVFRSYSANGSVKESRHPVTSRKQATLKQA